MSLPVMDAWEATRLLKEARGTQHIPIIALTATPCREAVQPPPLRRLMHGRG
jgi:CheY-like chemotaxis protein